jgi:hypothetical protein
MILHARHNGSAPLNIRNLGSTESNLLGEAFAGMGMGFIQTNFHKPRSGRVEANLSLSFHEVIAHMVCATRQWGRSA